MVRVVAVTLIRHGATVNNREKRYQGWMDPSLLPEEKERLASLRTSFSIPDLVISSDLKRCTETATTLFPYERIIQDGRLREMNFGDFEGKSYDQLKNKQVYRSWVDNAFQTAPPNGESFQSFVMRMQEGWQNAIQHFKDENINDLAIITHAGVIRFFLEKYSPIKKSYWEWAIEPGCGYRLTAEIEQLRRGDRCISCSGVPSMENPTG
ncbi:histidine phosphatase family protein [Pueribacillus theae]|uniref:Histidine phosphatase family protein n=1 Tax=Pueribacillus theae TaxID=2171751 RepID=A0A2U1K5F0_9BACI|nr:histidine phosphatase family protein [Pueribacillus theae]PWA12223.1 histidine phosphatase family protein [Pueribacillus theae]